MEGISKQEKCIWGNFTNQYSLSKTVRFELKPIGKTLENIERIGLIEEDEQRALDYKEVKKVMDKYFKYFIDKALENVSLDLNQLRNYQKLYEELKTDRNSELLKREFSRLQKEMRVYLHNQVKGKGDFKDFFGKEFIKKILPNYSGFSSEDKEYVEKFKDWNTYFTGFYENRKNIFEASKEIPTSIYYRIIHENLPKFIENYNKIQILKEYTNKGFDFSEIEANFKKELGEMSLSVFFSLDNFNHLLNQKGIDKINLIIGGYSKENGNKVQGLNEKINFFSQAFFKEDKEKFRKIRKLKLEILFKQILSDRESNSFIFETINNDDEVIEKVNLFSQNFINSEIESKLKTDILTKIKEYDIQKIYLKNDFTLSNLSQRLFKDYSKINSALELYAKCNIDNLKGNKEEKFQKWVKKTKYFSIYEIEEGLRLLRVYEDMDEKDKEIYISYVGQENVLSPVSAYFSRVENNEGNDLFDNIRATKNLFERLVVGGFKKEKEDQVLIIKNYLDSIMDLFHFIKPFHIDSKSDGEKTEVVLDLDFDFYTSFNEIYLGDPSKNLLALKDIFRLYNQVRNYLTKRSYETQKFKLNFQNSTLLAGWDVNKERDNTSILFRKNGNYFLGIMSRGNNKSFLKLEGYNGEDYYEKMDYKLLPGPDKMLPKVFFSKSNIDFFNPSEEILEIRNTSSHTKNGSEQDGYTKKDFNINDCHKMIDFYKESLQRHKEWCEFNFKFKETKNYNDLSEFYQDVSNQGYSISFRKISDNYINQLVEEGKLFLFQIYNKDFSRYSKGRKNLHTIYWCELFSEENLKDVVYKLNGEAEVFYRKASISYNITHPEGEKVKNKDPIDNKETSLFKYDLIKDKRYSEDKFLFHCPMTINFKSKDNSYSINTKVNKTIKESFNNINILSVDRGERHLAYWTLLDLEGNILEDGSFNVLSDDLGRERDYHNKLEKLEGRRADARRSWSKIENIKDLKEGYLSQIVHQISKIAIKNNAIIIFEDLNFGFKRGRFKIEKQIYQKFERALIEKLNFLMFKDRKNNEIGGALKAFQLTPKFDSFKKLGKQSGLIYYVDPYLTSKICPNTGFVNLLYPKYENENQAREFFKKFEYIKYNQEEDLFEFNFNYSNFTKKDTKLIKDNWSIWSYGIRLRQFRDEKQNNQWNTKEEDVTSNLKELFVKCHINYYKEGDLLPNILESGGVSLLKGLMYNLSLILQLRNSRINSNQDYILSCVKDKNDNFFDSREAKEGDVKNADANGAYHIGIKGLMMIEKIKQAEEIEGVKSEHLKITKDEFVNYVIARNW